MKENFTIFAVDDDPLTLELIHGVLDRCYTVECFSDVASCRARLDEMHPDMILLDVRMPDMDGYSFCRVLKADPASRPIPVTFVSAQDTLEARLLGYDAGGDDFILKPFETDELLRKARVAQQMADSARRIRQQLDDSELLSSLVMANMDEYAILVRFLREVIGCETPMAVAECGLALLQRFGLEGVIQVRLGGPALTVSARGLNQPLEASVLQHVSSLGRIFEFRNRSVHNFERLTMLINNMPLHDPELCGRLRDHLCIAAESAEARLQALATQDLNARNETGIRQVMERIQDITGALRQAHLEDSTASSDLVMRFENGLAKCFINLGLTEGQERELGDLVTGFTGELMRLSERSITAHEPLSEINGALESLLSRAALPA